MVWSWFLFAALAPAPSQEPTAGRLTVEWDAPARCPSAAEVRDGATAYLVGTEHPPARANGKIVEHGPGRWELRLTITIESGAVRRVLAAESCAVLADAASLMIAVAIDPTRAAAADRAVRPPPPAMAQPWPHTDASAAVQRPEPTPTPRRDAPRPVASRPGRAVTGHVHAEAVADVGALPTIAAGISGSAGVTVGRGRVEATWRYLFPQDVEATDQPDAGATLRLWTLGVRGCLVSVAKRLELPLCVGVRGGVLRGEGFGLAVPRTARPAWAAVEAGIAAQWFPVRWLGLGVALGPWLGLLRPGFAIDDLGRLHRADRVGFSARGGLIGRFF